MLNGNIQKNPKIHARLTKKIPGIFPASVVLVHLEKCEFSAHIASCGHMKDVLMEVATVVAPNCQSDENGVAYVE